MINRPTRLELLHAVEYYLADDVIPATSGPVQFRGRVALNVIRLLIRELETLDERLGGEFEDLNRLLGDETPRPDTLAGLEATVADLDARLAERIRDGDADEGEFRAAALEVLRRDVIRKLDVDNPKLAGRIREEIGETDK